MEFPGSLILVGGDPGVGKSTLLLQVIFCLRNLRVNMLDVRLKLFSIIEMAIVNVILLDKMLPNVAECHGNSFGSLLSRIVHLFSGE